jgi:hypothetical protein
MTRTEERLQDALHASAGRVRDDRLRPLPDVEPGAERETGPRSAWRGWLVPAAAAVSVALIIGLAVAVTGHAWRPASGPSADSSRTAVGFPKYFADFTGSIPPGLTMRVRSTSTGAVVASAPFPKVPGSLGGQRPGGAAISADPSGRYLLLTYRDQRGGSHTTWIDHGKLRFLPLKHPNPGLVISAW